MRPTAFPVVAIAASAGGLEAVSELLAAAAPHSGMAYIVVQHLDPTHQSLLPEILAKKTTMEVVPAAEGLTVEPDHVYVIPPNVTLTLQDTVLHLTPRERGPARHKPADALLKSLAESRGDAAISVILSGGDSDGSLGTQQIKHSGGITFAQEPSSARFPSMPRSAIETGCVDFVLHPRQIAGELARLGAHPYLRSVGESADSAGGEMPEAATAAEEERLRRIFRRLRSAHGVDFTHYKRSTLRRRLARRMALQKIDGPAEYLALIESDPAEATALYQDFLIRVTGFFRDPESFEGLAQRVFPSLCEGHSPKEPVRIWVPGCATGEETFSIAMTLVEHLGERLSPESIQIFGTDVSEAAIEKARAGIYLDTIAQEVSAERLARFFVKMDDHYRIAKSIRDLCIFARQDVTRDPPFSRLDLVSCRNLLIYLDAAIQRRVMQVFHYALRPHGFLMLGPSESVGQATDLFELTDKHHRIYARKATPMAPAVDLVTRARTPYGRPRDAVGEEGSVALEADSVLRESDRLLLARFAPASLLVDEALNILQVRGETGPYLELASGAPSLNLHRVARPELLVEIIPAVQEVRESGSGVRREGLSIDQLRSVSIEVIPLKRLNTERCYLILFDDGSRPPSGRRAQPPTTALPESEKDRRLAQLEREIAAMRAYQQATMEEHEAVKEELKSAHEEVLSANEEFQSTNEELETSKEELQSANEELTTTNEELRNRNRELAVVNAELERARGAAERAQSAAEAAGIASEQARRYADSIVESMREPLLVLDEELRILRANQAYYRDFGERPELTEGRLIYEVGNGQWNVGALRERLSAVLSRGEPMTDCEITHELPSRGRRAMSLSARRIPGDRQRSELILLAIEDITERRTRSESLRESARRKDEFLAMLAHELRNPLAPITHAVHLLRDRHADPASVKLYEMMGRQTQRLVRLVDELLDVARISRGLIAVKREPVDLVIVVREAVEASRPRIDQAHHELSLVLPEEPVLVSGDSVRLEQVVCNLLENAAKYTPPGGQITLTLRRQEGNEVVLIVRDTGIGLDPAAVDGIFELFMQVDRSLAHSGGGLGLGLAVVRRILELHGGRIEAHSAGLGMGTEFIVRLPVLPGSLRVLSTTHAEATPSTVVPRRVLVVDDNADSAHSMALIARSWGHEVATAQDGAEALAVAKSFRPDTALIDIGLPGMDGYELAHRLRGQHDGREPRLLMVAMTGYGRSEDREAAHAAGFDVHVVKPADLEELRRVLAHGSTPSGS
ncbi:MAG TPA: chemotaxis protein CheB [Steroidobacteraceae bacterium]|nr:chemotaxis protein CheB [Steroidobacteraceae bacterium]